jgi:hypothetical protein
MKKNQDGLRRACFEAEFRCGVFRRGQAFWWKTLGPMEFLFIFSECRLIFFNRWNSWSLLCCRSRLISQDWQAEPSFGEKMAVMNFG